MLTPFGRHSGGITSNSKQRDKEFKGRLMAVEREVESSSNGRHKVVYRFVIKGMFSERVFELRGEPSHDLRTYYTIGEKVLHVAGYPVPIKLSRRPGEKKICVDCGELIPSGKNRCQYCGKGVVIG